MKEWDDITRRNIKIPEEDGEVSIDNYKTDLLEKAGVYLIYNNQERLMYVGQSRNLKRRIDEHFRTKRKGFFINKVKFIYIEKENSFITDSYLDLYETLLIRKLKPRFNKQQSSPMRYL